MSDTAAQPVLRCGECNKPFDKRKFWCNITACPLKVGPSKHMLTLPGSFPTALTGSTLKRHGYYCRSRRAEKASRARSCLGCATSKARCDNRQPQCSRCIQKAVHCQYPANRPQNAGLLNRHGSNDAPSELQEASAPVLAGSTAVNQDLVNGGNAQLYSPSIAPDSLFMDSVDGFLEWKDLDIDFAKSLDTQVQDDIIQPLEADSSTLPDFSSSPPSIRQTIQPQQYFSSLRTSIPKTLPFIPRTISRRAKLSPETQKIADLMFHTFKSYPAILSRPKAHPPFIHQQLLASTFEYTEMEPLNNCISLVHMISSGIMGSRKLFWKNVRQECERFCQIYQEMTRWELLTALQALSIYIIIRLDEGETVYNDFDFLLLATVVALCEKFGQISSEKSSGLRDVKENWKDWIFEESKRRTCLVYRIMNMIVYFEPANICNIRSENIPVPLPAKKQLWEAADEFQWEVESETEPKTQGVFALVANSELLKLDAPRCNIEVFAPRSLEAGPSPQSARNWQEWCSGMDELGSLVMLAASLKA